MKNVLVWLGIAVFQILLICASIFSFRVILTDFHERLDDIELRSEVVAPVEVSEIKHSLVRVSSDVENDLTLIVRFPVSMRVDVLVGEKSISVNGEEVFRDGAAIEVYNTDIFPIAGGGLQLVIKILTKESELLIDAN